MSNSTQIEQYQIIYQENPHSKVFAPLSEAYRKMGLIKEALKVAKAGVRLHPQFAGGRVALGRALLKNNEVEPALTHLKKAVELAPENILAHSLMAQSYLKLKKPKEALKAFKMVLFFSPDHEKAQKAVKKLESLTADEYEADLFQMKPLTPRTIAPRSPRDKKNKGQSGKTMGTSSDKHTSSKKSQATPPKAVANNPLLDRYLSLIDAYLTRKDTKKALQFIKAAEKEFQKHPEVQRRLKILQLFQLKERGVELRRQERKSGKEYKEGEAPSPSLSKSSRHAKNIDDLNRLLAQIKERRHPL